MRIERDQMDQRGFALLIVLWIFMVLFVLGAEFASGMRQNAQATVNFADETQSYYLATAAANRTFYRALIARDEATLGLTAGEVESEEDLAAYLMTLKHRSVSPDLVDDTASCLASMRMPHLMPGTDPNASTNTTNTGASTGASTGNSLNTTEGQVLRFRDTARTPGLPMATPEDRFWLSDVSCFVRQHCCEFFLAEGEEDNLTKTRSKSGKVSLLLARVSLDLIA